MVTKHTMKIFDCMGELEIGQAGYFLIRSCTYYCLFVSMFLYIILCVKVRKTTMIKNRYNQVLLQSSTVTFPSKKGSKDQESIQSSTTPVPGYQMGKKQSTINITNKSQEVSHFPSGDHKAA